MKEKIKTHWPKIVEQIRAFQDVRAVGLLAFGFVAVLITWSGIKIVDTNYGLQRDITTLEQQNEVRKLQNRNLKLENEFYETDEYLDMEARRNFGLAAPGETVVTISPQVAERYVVKQPPTGAAAVQTAREHRSNAQAWFDFLLHR